LGALPGVPAERDGFLSTLNACSVRLVGAGAGVETVLLLQSSVWRRNNTVRQAAADSKRKPPASIIAHQQSPLERIGR
jgi:hypothetical protein